MKVDWDINVGNIIMALMLLVGFLAAHKQNIERIQAIETKVEMIYNWFLAKVVKQ